MVGAHKWQQAKYLLPFPSATKTSYLFWTGQCNIHSVQPLDSSLRNREPRISRIFPFVHSSSYTQLPFTTIYFLIKWNRGVLSPSFLPLVNLYSLQIAFTSCVFPFIINIFFHLPSHRQTSLYATLIRTNKKKVVPQLICVYPLKIQNKRWLSRRVVCWYKCGGNKKENKSICCLCKRYLSPMWITEAVSSCTRGDFISRALIVWFLSFRFLQGIPQKAKQNSKICQRPFSFIIHKW